MSQQDHQIVTANRLADGAVVYLTARGDWSHSIVDGRIARGEFETKDLLAWAGRSAERNEVVGPYLMAVDLADGRIARGEFESRDLMAWADRSVDRNEVVGPYLMAIGLADSENNAIGMRETIRAGGPTVETGR